MVTTAFVERQREALIALFFAAFIACSAGSIPATFIAPPPLVSAAPATPPVRPA